MTPKTIFGFTFENNNVSKSAHIPNVFKKSLDMLKSQRICAIKGLDLKSVPTYLTVKSDVNLIQPITRRVPSACGATRCIFEILKWQRTGGRARQGSINPLRDIKEEIKKVYPPMMVVRPQFEDIKIQLAQSEQVENINHLGEIPPSVDSDKTINLAPYPLMDRAYPQIEEKVYPQTEVGRFPPMAEKSVTPMMEAPFTPLGERSNHKTIAKSRLNNYPNHALSKILKLALVGYRNEGVHSASSGFFVRNISMRSHIVMAKLWRDTLECAGFLCSLSTNPFQLCHPYLVVNGKASFKNEGVHSHA